MANRPIDATEADAFSMVAVQYLDGVAVEDGDYGPVKLAKEE